MNISLLKVEGALRTALPGFDFRSEYPNDPVTLGQKQVIYLANSSTLPTGTVQPYRMLLSLSGYSGDRYALQQGMENLANAMSTFSPTMVGQTVTAWYETFRSEILYDQMLYAHTQYIQYDLAVRVDS